MCAAADIIHIVLTTMDEPDSRADMILQWMQVNVNGVMPSTRGSVTQKNQSETRLQLLLSLLELLLGPQHGLLEESYQAKQIEQQLMRILQSDAVFSFDKPKPAVVPPNGDAKVMVSQASSKAAADPQAQACATVSALLVALLS